MRVFPTSRNLRRYYEAHLESNQLIEKAITLGELFSSLVLIPDRTFIDAESRLILLEQASRFEAFERLHIERDLLSFLYNSHYIFRFFEELASENVSIKDLHTADTYAEYEEHLEALALLKDAYKALLDKHGLIDSFFVREHYELNQAFIGSLERLDIELEGYFTNWELELLEAVCKYTEVVIHFFANAYNQKMQQKFEKYGFRYEGVGPYRINMSRKKSEKVPYKAQSQSIESLGFSERILQVAFVKKSLYDMVHKKKIDPSRIVVVVPDESFAQNLRLFDHEKNLNFAMGYPFREGLFFRRVEALIRYFEHPTVEQTFRMQKLLEGMESIKEVWRIHYSEPVSMELFSSLIENFCIGLQEKEQELIDKELYRFKKLSTMLKGLSFKLMLQLFLKRLSTATIDDARGGKVTVMGLLETRGMRYDGVIVVDFNDNFVPKRSDKDLFLSAQVKQFAQLPTPKERESLQKYFYSRLFEQAKQVAISYTQNDMNRASKFLAQLGIKGALCEDERPYAEILYTKKEIKKSPDKELILPYSFQDKRLSATALKSFLECKRRYYYRYVAKIEGFEIPQDIPKEYEIGTWLHDILKELYEQKDSFDTSNALKSGIEKALAKHRQKGEMGRYLVRLWIEKLDSFYRNEAARFKEGVRVWKCEVPLSLNCCGLKLLGTIDRIDRNSDGGLEILDYKSGAYYLAKNEKEVEKATDFQLQFYELLAQTYGNVERVGFYDLKRGVIADEVMRQEKKARLKELLEELSLLKEVNFELTDDYSRCRYCDYQILCGRA